MKITGKTLVAVFEKDDCKYEAKIVDGKIVRLWKLLGAGLKQGYSVGAVLTAEEQEELING